jgi:hypothetical protein
MIPYFSGRNSTTDGNVISFLLIFTVISLVINQNVHLFMLRGFLHYFPMAPTCLYELNVKPQSLTLTFSFNFMEVIK